MQFLADRPGFKNCLDFVIRLGCLFATIAPILSLETAASWVPYKRGSSPTCLAAFFVPGKFHVCVLRDSARWRVRPPEVGYRQATCGCGRNQRIHHESWRAAVQVSASPATSRIHQPGALSRQGTFSEASSGAHQCRAMMLASSRLEAPNASSDFTMRSSDTVGSPASIFATSDWLERMVLARAV